MGSKTYISRSSEPHGPHGDFSGVTSSGSLSDNVDGAPGANIGKDADMRSVTVTGADMRSAVVEGADMHPTAVTDADAVVSASLSQIGATMEALFNTINARKSADADSVSYTKSLFDGKLDVLLKKVSEESLESCLAAKECEMLKRSLGEWANVAKVADAGTAGAMDADTADTCASRAEDAEAADAGAGRAMDAEAADAGAGRAEGKTDTRAANNPPHPDDAQHTQLPSDNLPIGDPDSHPITRTMQGFNESMQLAQAIHECNQIQRSARELDESIDHLRYEAADVIYHLLVLLARFDIPLDEIAAELNMRMRENERPQGCVMLHPDHVRRGK